MVRAGLVRLVTDGAMAASNPLSVGGPFTPAEGAARHRAVTGDLPAFACHGGVGGTSACSDACMNACTHAVNLVVTHGLVRAVSHAGTSMVLHACLKSAPDTVLPRFWPGPISRQACFLRRARGGANDAPGCSDCVEGVRVPTTACSRAGVWQSRRWLTGQWQRRHVDPAGSVASGHTRHAGQM